MGGDSVEEVTVMADHEDRILEIGEIIFEPCDSLEVEVIGRLVEQQIVGVAEESLGEEYADLLVGAHVLHEHIVAVFLDAEAGEERGGVALGVPAFEFGEFLLKFGGADAVGVGEVLLGIDGILLLHHVPEDGMSAEDSLNDGAFVEFEVVLREDREAFAGTEGDGAVSGGELAGEDAHERRLAGAVGADDAVAIAVGESKVDVLEERALTKLYAEVVDLYHL